MAHDTHGRLIWTPLPKNPPPFLWGQKADDLLHWLASLRYLTAEQAMHLIGWIHKSTAVRQLERMTASGLTQAAWISYRGRRTRVWTLSARGGYLLGRHDPDWASRNADWTSPASDGVSGHAIAHTLDRNLFCIDVDLEVQGRREAGIVRPQAPDEGWWMFWESGPPIHLATLGGGTRTDFVPDAILTINGHPWYLELERSWRVDTLTRKLRQYDTFLKARLWREMHTSLPRVLFLLSDANTQDIAYTTYMARADAAHRDYLYVMTWDQYQRGYEAVHWSSDGERQTVQWLELQAPLARFEPTSWERRYR
jgi:hypothetical protein